MLLTLPRALQSDRNATLILLHKENADVCFNWDVQSYMKIFKSELAIESLQRLHHCSMSLKRPQLSSSPRLIPTKHSTLTQHILSLCVLNSLPFTCWSATCQFGHLKCLQASMTFFVPLVFKASQPEVSQKGSSINTPLADTLTREQFPTKELATATTSCLSQVSFVLLCLVYLFNKRSQHCSNIHKVWETSDATLYQHSQRGAKNMRISVKLASRKWQMCNHPLLKSKGWKGEKYNISHRCSGSFPYGAAYPHTTALQLTF